MKKIEIIAKVNGSVDFLTVNENDIFSVSFLSPEDIIKDLPKRMSEEDTEALKDTPKESLIRWHSDLGRWIRNTYGLWFEENPYTDIDHHPDDVSFEIIERFYAMLNSPTDPYKIAKTIMGDN